MEPDFWHNKWKNNDTGFHNEVPNPLLLAHWHKLNIAENGRILVPLCGKTLDIAWFLSQGYRIVGVELSKIAVEQLFQSLKIKPKIKNYGGILQHYQAAKIDIFAGDVFSLTKQNIGTIDAVYDRAALVALPYETRTRYAAHIKEISNNAPQLLICFEYDQRELKGPPFSIKETEIIEHYSDAYTLNKLDKVTVEGGLKGKCEATESIWLLSSDSLGSD